MIVAITIGVCAPQPVVNIRVQYLLYLLWTSTVLKLTNTGNSDICIMEKVWEAAYPSPCGISLLMYGMDTLQTLLCKSSIALEILKDFFQLFYI